MVEAGVKQLARDLKDKSYTGIEKMVRGATSSDGPLDRTDFEPIARSCSDYSQYGLMLMHLARRMRSRKYPLHVLKSLELLKYLLTTDLMIPTMRQQLIDDLRNNHHKDVDTLTTYSDSQWSMTIRSLALEILDHMRRAPVSAPRAATSPLGSAPPPPTLGSTTSTGSLSGTSTPETSPTGVEAKATSSLRVKLDGIFICDCARTATGTGEHDIVRAIDFYFDSLKSYPSFYTLSDGSWQSSSECVRKNLVVQTVPGARGGRVTETNFGLLLAVSA